jgi:hypothetical protein
MESSPGSPFEPQTSSGLHTWQKRTKWLRPFLFTARNSAVSLDSVFALTSALISMNRSFTPKLLWEEEESDVRHFEVLARLCTPGDLQPREQFATHSALVPEAGAAPRSPEPGVNSSTRGEQGRRSSLPIRG